MPGRLPQLAIVDLDQLARLRAALLPVMEPIGKRRYAWGTIGPENMWSDNAPQQIASSRMRAGRWPAGYEMRTWAGAGNDIAASVLEFATPEEARAFFAQAASTRCHRAGTATAAASPPRARNVVWVNPDRATEEDVFLLRDSRVYRLADVRPQSTAGSTPREQQRGLSLVDHLACSLPGAECASPTTSPVSPSPVSPQRSS